MNRLAEPARRLLPGSARMLLAINTLFAGASALSGTFLNIYFWKLLHGLSNIAVYNFFIFFFTSIGYATAGWLMKRTDRLQTLRIGVGVLAVFYVLILVLGPNVRPFYALLGCLQGFGTGFYWVSFNVLVFEVTEPETRDEFNGANGFLFSVASGASPLLAGQILTFLPAMGYTVLFAASFSLFIGAVLCTWRLTGRKRSSPYNLYAGFHPEEQRDLWHRLLGLALMMGFREGTLAFLPFLLVFLVTRSEAVAGRYLVLTAAATLIAYYVVKRTLTYERRMLFKTLSAIMLGLSVVWLLFDLTTGALFLFGVVNALFTPLLLTPYACISLDVMGKLPLAAQRMSEYLVIREFAVNTGRCLSILFLLAFAAVLPERQAIQLSFWLIGLAPLLALFFYRSCAHCYHERFVRLQQQTRL